MDTGPHQVAAPADAAAPPGAGDEALLQLVASTGSREALDELYRRYAGRVLAVLVRMLGGHAEAEELLQEVFVECWRRSSRYDPRRASARTWLFVIARSRALDALRARQSRGHGRGDPEAADDLRAPAELRPDRNAERSEARADVHAALDSLKPTQRQVLELSYFEGLSQSEIAEQLAIPIGTVKSRMIAGMKALREHVPNREGDR